MNTINHINRKTLLETIMWILFIFTTSTIVAWFFQGTRLFSSFSYYVKFSSFGWGLGFGFWLGHSLIGHYTEKKLDWTKNLKRANVISLSLYITSGMIVSLALSYLFGFFVLENRGKVLHIDALIKSLMIMFLDLIFIAIYYSTNLTKYWKKAIEKNEELKRENLLSKYEALKNQVNPHFLFNNLNTLTGIVEQKPELATDFIKKFSDIYRYVLEQNEKELVTIAEEMKFVDDFIYLTKMRFGSGLLFSWDIHANLNKQIVPLGMQMLVENAIKHNVISDDAPLKITIEIQDSFIKVENNLQKKKAMPIERKPLGLDNLKKRYAYLSGSPVEVIESDRTFTVKIPVIEP